MISCQKHFHFQESSGGRRRAQKRNFCVDGTLKYRFATQKCVISLSKTCDAGLTISGILNKKKIILLPDGKYG